MLSFHRNPAYIGAASTASTNANDDDAEGGVLVTAGASHTFKSNHTVMQRVLAGEMIQFLALRYYPHHTEEDPNRLHGAMNFRRYPWAGHVPRYRVPPS